MAAQLSSHLVLLVVVVSALLVLCGGWYAVFTGMLDAHSKHTVWNWVKTLIRILVLCAMLILAGWSLLEILPMLVR